MWQQYEQGGREVGSGEKETIEPSLERCDIDEILLVKKYDLWVLIGFFNTESRYIVFTFGFVACEQDLYGKNNSENLKKAKYI